MANNRLYIRCKECGKIHFIAKHYSDGWYTDEIYEGFNESAAKFLNNIYDEHDVCFALSNYGDEIFELITEDGLYKKGIL